MYYFGPNDFLKVAVEGKVAPLITELPLSKETPVSAYMKLGAGQDSFILESAGESPSLNEYSFVGMEPYKVIRTSGDDPLPRLQEAVSSFSPGPIETGLPFWGGAVGYLSYDVARYIEKLPTLARDDLNLPEAVFFFPGVLLVFDHKRRKLYAVINEIVGADARASLARAAERLERVIDKLSQKEIYPERQKMAGNGNGGLTANMSQTDYEKMVRRAREYIFAGDIFQANLSIRWRIPMPEDSLTLYSLLRAINPSPFAAYLECGSFQLVSSSPERLFTLRNGIIETRPIAGTRRRGVDDRADEWLTEDLILNEKERAEHVMLVDLERNDLGRIAKYGTVEPTEMFEVEKYSHVIHIVSNIQGELAPGKDQFDVVRAAFPGGTITGCPKVRCMEIIEELEPTRRGPYTGSIGYFGFNGNMDMNIIIRTFIVKDGYAYVQAGAGIVADSDPAREYYEAASKAAALLQAAGCEREDVRWEKLPISTER